MKTVGGIFLSLVVAAIVGVFGFIFGKTKAPKAEMQYVTQLEYRDTCNTVVLVDSFQVYQEVRKGLLAKQKKVKPVSVTPIPPDTIADFMEDVVISMLDEQPKTPKLVQYEYNSELLKIKEYVIVVGDIIEFERDITLDTLLLKSKYTTTVVTTVREPVLVTQYPTKIGISGSVNSQSGFGVGAYTLFPQGQLLHTEYDFRNKSVGITAGLPVFTIKKRK